MAKQERKKRMNFWIYATALMAIAFIIALVTWPLLSKSSTSDKGMETNNNGGTQVAEVKPIITLGGTYIQPSPEGIILWTTIKLVDRKGRETFLSGLTKDNFSIVENYNGNTHNASILDISSISVPVRAVLVIDKSGSMEGSSGLENLQKIEVAKNAAGFFADQLIQEGNNYVAILPFAGDSVTYTNFLKLRNGETWFDKGSKDELKEAIEHIKVKVRGMTPLWQAVDVAIDQLSKVDEKSYKVIIVLSDGISNSGSVSFDSLLEKAKAKQIPIFTLAYGAESNIDFNSLTQLSSESGAGKEQVGSFIRVAPRDWPNRLREIGKGISSVYEVSWKSTGASFGTQVSVEVKVVYALNGENLEAIERRSYISPQK